jgi:hypothetical protein
VQKRHLAVLVLGLTLATFMRDTSTAAPREGDVRFKVTCQFDHSAPDDPIVFPNQPGAAHSHDFFGRRNLTASTDTYEELLAGFTTCNDSGDRAGYWTPSLYIDGVKTNPSRMTAYYRRGEKDGTIAAYPDGLKIVAEGGSTGWQCTTSTGAGIFSAPTPDGCRHDLTLRIEFPDCWDGVNTDSPDHRSHMAYSAPAGDHHACPASHPVPVPALTTYSHFGDVPAGATVTLSAGELHGDFFNGWVRSRLLERIDTCLNGVQRCDSGG